MARKAPNAIEQWWLDRRADFERDLAAVQGKKSNARKVSRLKNAIARIDTMLATFRVQGNSVPQSRQR